MFWGQTKSWLHTLFLLPKKLLLGSNIQMVAVIRSHGLIRNWPLICLPLPEPVILHLGNWWWMSTKRKTFACLLIEADCELAKKHRFYERTECTFFMLSIMHTLQADLKTEQTVYCCVCACECKYSLHNCIHKHSPSNRQDVIEETLSYHVFFHS